MRAIHGIWGTSYLRKRKPDWVREVVGIVWLGAEVELADGVFAQQGMQRNKRCTEHTYHCLVVCCSVLGEE